MFKKRYQYTLGQVENQLVLKSWWASFAVLPLANRMVIWVANHTELTPNQITLVSCLFRIASAVFFFVGEPLSLVSGATCFHLAYLIDCVDGPIARLKGKSSVFGRYFDHLSDLLGDLLILSALAYSQNLLFSYMILAMLFMHIVESYISYLANMALDSKEKLGGEFSSEIGKFFVVKNFLQYRKFFFSKNFKSFLSFTDYEALTFFIFPLCGLPLVGLKVGFYVLLITTMYTIFSTFMTIHFNGGKNFP